jgi:putative transposase
MGLSRTTFYDQPRSAADDTAIVEAIVAICNEFEHYGWRRVRAPLRQKGTIVNHKKIRRLMREHDLQPKMRRRFTATTDSDHNQPIFRNLVRDIIPDGPDQLWVADITYVTIIGGFAYVAVILDAWSRRVVGYAISRSIDTRLTLAALVAAIEERKPPPGCLHHSDRGSQGGLNRSTQHFILKERWSVVPWVTNFIEGLLRRRKRSYGIAGSAESR